MLFDALRGAALVYFGGLAVWLALQALVRRLRIDPVGDAAAAGAAPPAVLITGCDSGFGRGLARDMLSRGYRVFATCLTPDGAAALSSSVSADERGRLETPVFDVRDDEAMRAAGERVAEALGDAAGLHALVCNAGVFDGMELEATPIETYRFLMDVNYVGMVSTLKTFLPLVRKERGRVVLLSSIAGRLAAPAWSAYSATKHAVEAVGDSLRVEMRPFGVRVSMIEPSFTGTALVTEMPGKLKRAWDSASPEVRELYGEEYMEHKLRLLGEMSGMMTNAPEAVVSEISGCLRERYPRTRYVVGSDAVLLWAPFSMACGGLKDLVYGLFLSRPAGAV